MRYGNTFVRGECVLPSSAIFQGEVHLSSMNIPLKYRSLPEHGNAFKLCRRIRHLLLVPSILGMETGVSHLGVQKSSRSDFQKPGYYYSRVMLYR